MEKRFNSYVDSDFLKTFAAKKKDFNIEESGKELDIWRSLLKFYNEKTKLHLKLKNTSLKYMNTLDSSLIKFILKKVLQGSDEYKVINANENAQISFRNFKNYNFVFSSDNDFSQNISDNFGIDHIKFGDLINDWKKYYKSDTITVPKRANSDIKLGWGKLSLPKHYCNSLIVCDNYLLSDEKRMEDNLYPIFDFFLPENDLQIEFDLTIISSSFFNCIEIINGKKRYSTPTIDKIEEIHKNILSYINTYLNFSNLNLTMVYKELRDFHDRHLYSNGFVIKSGNSFTFFNEDEFSILPSETTIDIQPLPADNNEETIADTYAPFLKSIKEIVNNSTIFKGSKENRLLE